MSGDAHARPGHGQESGSQPISSQPRKAFVLPRSFKSLRSPVKAPQKLLEGLRVLSTIAIYTLTAAILLVYCYLIATKGVRWRPRTVTHRGTESLNQTTPTTSTSKAAPHPRILVVLPTSSITKLEEWQSDQFDLVHLNYGREVSNCTFCVYAHPASGVKWQLWESFTDSDWFQEHKSQYDWLWYPDDDLIFAPGDRDRFIEIATSSRFSVLQPSVCAGSEIHHPTLKQRPGISNKIVPIYTVELQMPFGKTSWWEAIKETYLRNQVFGFGVDLVWTKPVGHELGTGVVNAVCATHPYRKEGKRHVSGLGEGLLKGLTGDSLWDEYRKNKMRFRISFTAGRPEDDYWWHFKWDVRWARQGAKDCREVCGEGNTCAGGTSTDSCVFADTLRFGGAGPGAGAGAGTTAGAARRVMRSKGRGERVGEAEEEAGGGAGKAAAAAPAAAGPESSGLGGYSFEPEVYQGACGEGHGKSVTVSADGSADITAVSVGSDEVPTTPAACCACLVMDRGWPEHKEGHSLHHG